MNAVKTKHVFWTGGLDSTFRVINLLRTTEELVQPCYVIRHETSTGNEIDAMNNIMRAVTRLYPDLRSKLLPTINVNEDLIPSNEKVDAAAKAEGWMELLKLTSFCRRPRRKGRPCGTCGPCHDAVKVGLGFRLPFTSRMKVYNDALKEALSQEL